MLPSVFANVQCRAGVKRGKSGPGRAEGLNGRARQVGGGERKYHVVITAQGTAVHWQARVHYYWYRKARPPSVSAPLAWSPCLQKGTGASEGRSKKQLLPACKAVWE